MTVVIDRLEHALSLWESLCFRLSVAAQRRMGLRMPLLYRHEGPLRSFAAFRQHLLSAAPGQTFLAGRFIAPEDTAQLLAGLATLPLELWCWTLASRRIFALSEELCALLEATSLEGVRIGEIPWPFDAFAIDLPVPLVDHRGRSFDCLLVSRFQFRESGNESVWPAHILVRLIASDVAESPILNKYERERVTRLLQKRRWDEAHARCWRGLEGSDGMSFTGLLRLDYREVLDATLSESVDDLIWRSRPDAPALEAGYGEILHAALRIAMGTCLYLSTLPPKESNRLQWDRPLRKGNPDPKAIGDHALVCAVRNIHILDVEEHEAIAHGRSAPGVERCAHFRRGHWRRLPAETAEDAPRRIWVRPCLVRGDRLPPGSVPGGSGSVVV